ncbi:hypothetical protein HDE_05724 [Halotydeus destructor]|nr:hypothetical protein HDE_05724 [Halotydeus destructor]
MDQLEAVRRLVQDKCRHFEFEVFELAKVYEDDHFVNAFLEDNSNDMEKTAAAILKALVYRKKYQVYNIKTTDLPTEMFAWNARVGSDIYGKRVIWNNLGCYRNLFELVDVLIMLDFIHCRDLFESHEKFDVYVDLRCISFKSIDTRMNRKYSSMLTTCFPSMLDHMYICGLPGSMTFIIQGNGQDTSRPLCGQDQLRHSRRSQGQSSFSPTSHSTQWVEYSTSSTRTKCTGSSY